MNLSVVRGDITKFVGDVIVNAANAELLPGGGVCGAIHKAAGPDLEFLCKAYLHENSSVKTGSVAPIPWIPTPALQVKSVYQAVGPIWKEHYIDDAISLFAHCYEESLAILLDQQFTSIAFPCISTEIYGFPDGLVASTAFKEVLWFLRDHPSVEVVFYCFEEVDYLTYRNLQEISYIG